MPISCLPCLSSDMLEDPCVLDGIGLLANYSLEETLVQECE